MPYGATELLLFALNAGISQTRLTRKSTFSVDWLAGIVDIKPKRQSGLRIVGTADRIEGGFAGPDQFEIFGRRRGLAA